MSDLSTTPYLNNLPLQADDLRVELKTTSATPDSLQPTASLYTDLFQAPAGSDSRVLDIQPAAGMPADAEAHARHVLNFVGR